MTNIKELLEKQTNRIYAIIGDTKRSAISIELGVYNVNDIIKQSLLQFVDYLIEDLRGKKISAEILDWNIGYNHSTDDQITTLLSIKKEIEES